MYRRDHFNETLIIERCAELVAIEARASEIDALLAGCPRAAASRCGDLHVRRAVADRRPLLPELWSLADRRDVARRGGVRGDGVTACPRCGEGIAAGQEYCLECGLRLPGASRLGPAPSSPRQVMLPLLVAAVVAIAGAAAAIALTRDTATATTIVTATGGSETVRRRHRAAGVRARRVARRHDRLDERPRLGSEGRRPRRCRRARRAGAPARDCDVSACSIRRATRASIPGTGSCSPASIRASPRQRAACARPAAVQRGAHTRANQPLNPLPLVANSGPSL